jgi:hypothetical protein
MSPEQRGELSIELDQSGGKRRLRIGPDVAVGDMAEPVAVGPDDAPPGAAKPGVEAEDDQETRSITSSGTS